MSSALETKTMQKYGRIFNFSAGPSALPLEVLEEARDQMMNWNNSGMSVMELSHRSKQFDSIIQGAEQRLRELLSIPKNYHVLFFQGGASLQFSMIPMNFLPKDQAADYIVTGAWGEKAYESALLAGKTHLAYTAQEGNYNHFPKTSDIQFSSNPSYVHYTSNETVHGVQTQGDLDWSYPLVCDMSSDIISRPVDISKYALIYAGAQKNMGASGVTVAIVREDLIDRVPKDLPPMLDYRVSIKNKSMYNTPCCWGIYVCGLVFKWLQSIGGVEKIYQVNQEKANLIYSALDQSQGFYEVHPQKQNRSLMNIVFRLPNEDLTKLFVQEAQQHGFDGLPGHRAVGGCRASIYNAFPVEGCRQFSEFLTGFAKRNA